MVYLFLKNDFEVLLKKREEWLKKYNEAAKASGEACNQGGDTWHDNFFYEEAIRQMHLYSSLVRRIDKTISRVRLVDLPETGDSRARLGSIVKIEYEPGSTRWVKIGSFDVSYLPQKSGETFEEAMSISYASPLGKALIGAQAGEERVFVVDTIKKVVKVEEIKRSP